MRALRKLFRRKKQSSGWRSVDEERLQALTAQLDAVEAEMRAIGFWHDGEPPETLGNFMEMPTFESWLQWVFLPNARHAVTENRLPTTSQVGLMAMRQYDYHSYVEEAQQLLHLLNEFDRLVEGRGDS